MSVGRGICKVSWKHVALLISEENHVIEAVIYLYVYFFRESRGRDGMVHTCFDVYHCGHSEDPMISVYVCPLAKFVDENVDGEPIALPISKEYSEIVAVNTFIH